VQGHVVSRPDVSAFSESQDGYKGHTGAEKFPSNAYVVNSVLDLWQSDLLILQKFAKYNNNYRYILSVIDVFSKYLHLVPLKTTTGSVVAEAFYSILRDSQYTKPLVHIPLVVQTKEKNI
jgi:hypothetical protein